MTAALAAALFVLIATIVHLSSIALAAFRCWRPARLPSACHRPGMSLVRTIRDRGPHEEETLRSSFLLDHPDYDLIFCAASESDPAVPLVRRLMAAHPHVRARLLIGEDAISANPKLNNMIKGWRAAEHAWIVFADSNLLLPPDYLDRVLAAWQPDSGLVCAPPIGSAPQGLWSELECAFLNTYQARWQYAADRLGLGFAQGKTMLFRREVLESQGGITSLACELAEDAAATKIIRGAGLRIHLAAPGFHQPLGRRSARHVMARQLRWAQLRRLTFPGWFSLEILTGALLPMMATAFAAPAFDMPPLLACTGLCGLWFAAEAVLAKCAGWHLSWQAPLAWLLRDCLIPLVWLRAWTSQAYEWGGHKISWRPGQEASMAGGRAMGLH